VRPSGQHLADTFTVQDCGESPAHYQVLGIEAERPPTDVFPARMSRANMT
jgi:hypothetical protein